MSLTAQNVWVVMPVKRLLHAKGRLTSVLGESRPAFARALALRTMEVLAQNARTRNIIVVTDDPVIATDARSVGATIVEEGAEDINSACAAGLAAAAVRGADFCFIVHSDLPTLTSKAVSELLDMFDARRTVLGQNAIGLVPCKEGKGTNAAICSAMSGFVPEFGDDSLARHLAAAEHAVVLDHPIFAFDLDDENDLRRYAERIGTPLFDRDSLVRSLNNPLTATRSAALIPLSHTPRVEESNSYITYSRKVFLPLTELCRDVCHYCTFAKQPRVLSSPYMSIEKVLKIARRGAELGCKEALFTLGERPELRYGIAADWLRENEFTSTLDYVRHVAAIVRDETGLLVHINAGCMAAHEMAALRPVSASMGLMLESVADRLCEKGNAHHGSPDKRPSARLATIEEAGRQRIPFTTGLLIGIGETRDERIAALEAIHTLHRRYGHIQEIIVQNFVPKPGTRMAQAPAPDIGELIWTIEAARTVFGHSMSIQAPPNLSPDDLSALIAAGINDWGGVSPLTPDHVNPEMPWPEISKLSAATEAAGKTLVERLTIYPDYVRKAEIWLDPQMRKFVCELADGAGMGREDKWRAGRSTCLAEHPVSLCQTAGVSRIQRLVDDILDFGSGDLKTEEIAALFAARGKDFQIVCDAADALRAEACGDDATYVVNRNINYTNICSYKCGFCAFSKGSRHHSGAERPYRLDVEEIARRVLDARVRGGTEVCLQGGIHPSFTGETYVEILRAVRRADPDMHIHAFSPLEVMHGASTLRLSLRDYLALLRTEGLGSLPGTAAEILHDPIRALICPDKLSSEQWLEVIETAHEIGLPTTSTIMFGHVEGYLDWAVHLQSLRHLQSRTKGLTEFVPLPFVAHEAPMYKRGLARPGPTAREAILMHAVARLVLFPLVPNIQASWVKMGREGMRSALQAGANDLGGTLMDESITRAAGATHGQEFSMTEMSMMARSLGRRPVRRTTLYGRCDNGSARMDGDLVSA